VWSGYINLQTLTLTKVQGDDYFGTLSVFDNTSTSQGYRITSDQGAIFTSGKTFVPNFSFWGSLFLIPTRYITSVCTFPTTSIIQVNIFGAPSYEWTLFNDSNFQDAAIEIKVFK
jgi:hypothetical protein